MNPENIDKEYKSIYVKPAEWQHVYNSIAIAFYWLSFELKHKRQSLSQQFFCRLWIFECNTSFVCVCVSGAKVEYDAQVTHTFVVAKQCYYVDSKLWWLMNIVKCEFDL